MHRNGNYFTEYTEFDLCSRRSWITNAKFVLGGGMYVLLFCDKSIILAFNYCNGEIQSCVLLNITNMLHHPPHQQCKIRLLALFAFSVMLIVGIGSQMQCCFTSVSDSVLPLNNKYTLASCHTHDCWWQLLKGLLFFHYVNLLRHSIFALSN